MVPLPIPSGLKEALGWMLLMESKFSEAQKIPDKTFVSSLHVPSTLRRIQKITAVQSYAFGWIITITKTTENMHLGGFLILIITIRWCHAIFLKDDSLCDGVLEPDPELSSRGRWLIRLPPLHGPPVALCQGDVQLTHGEFGDNLTQRLGKQPVVRHYGESAKNKWCVLYQNIKKYSWVGLEFIKVQSDDDVLHYIHFMRQTWHEFLLKNLAQFYDFQAPQSLSRHDRSSWSVRAYVAGRPYLFH